VKLFRIGSKTENLIEKDEGHNNLKAFIYD
jgi:hypothetical protein